MSVYTAAAKMTLALMPLAAICGFAYAYYEDCQERKAKAARQDDEHCMDLTLKEIQLNFSTIKRGEQEQDLLNAAKVALNKTINLSDKDFKELLHKVQNVLEAYLTVSQS